MNLAEKEAAIRQSLLNAALLKNKTLSTPSLSKQEAPTEILTDDADIRQSPEACSPKWNAEEKALLDWVIKNINSIELPLIGESTKRELLQAQADGPTGEWPSTKEFRSDLELIRSVIEKELVNKNLHEVSPEKDVQISAKIKDFTINQDPNGNLLNMFHADEKTSWTNEEQFLIDWFNKQGQKYLPKPPFKLSAYETVEGDNFYVYIKRVISAGPNYLEAKTGPLKKYLLKLKEIVENKQLQKGVNVL